MTRVHDAPWTGVLRATRRRWFRCSIASLLLLTSVCCVVVRFREPILAWVRPPADTEPVPLRLRQVMPLRTHQGEIPIVNLPAVKELRQTILTAAEWDAAWQVLTPAEEAPAFDPSREVAYLASGDNENQVTPMLHIDKRGRIQVVVWRTLVGYVRPVHAKFVVVIASRTGVAALAGRKVPAR